MIKPGTRVIAFRDIDGDTVNLYGRGTYVGHDHVPNGAPIPPDFDGEYSPRIELDRGGTLYGCQCWWGEEQMMAEKLSGHTFVLVDLPENPRGTSN